MCPLIDRPPWGRRLQMVGACSRQNRVFACVTSRGSSENSLGLFRASLSLPSFPHTMAGMIFARVEDLWGLGNGCVTGSGNTRVTGGKVLKLLGWSGFVKGLLGGLTRPENGPGDHFQCQTGRATARPRGVDEANRGFWGGGRRPDCRSKPPSPSLPARGRGRVGRGVGAVSRCLTILWRSPRANAT